MEEVTLLKGKSQHYKLCNQNNLLPEHFKIKHTVTCITEHNEIYAKYCSSKEYFITNI